MAHRNTRPADHQSRASEDARFVRATEGCQYGRRRRLAPLRSLLNLALDRCRPAMRLWWMGPPPDAQVLEARAQRRRTHDILWVPARYRDPARARLNPVLLCRRP